jgi:hypothetical protein
MPATTPTLILVPDLPAPAGPTSENILVAMTVMTTSADLAGVRPGA